jgi:hypothetical protein
VKVCPATVSVPLRLGGAPASLLAATVYVTAPLPVPDPPAVTVIQLTFATADHVHVDPAVTLMLPLPPPFGTDWLVGEIE